MRIRCVLLSPALNMHQRTADLANRMLQAGSDVSLVTTRYHPRARCLLAIRVSTSVGTQDTGFSAEAPRFSGARDARAEALREAPSDPVRLARMGQAVLEWCESQQQAERASIEQVYARVAGND